MVIRDLCEQAGSTRERQLLEAVIAGKYDPVVWVPCEMDWVAPNSVGGSLAGKVIKVRWLVANDALKMDKIRVNVTHRTAQLIADVLGCSLPTSRMSDLTHVHASIKAPSQVRVPDATMSTTTAMIQHSGLIDKAVGTTDLLISTVGKDWLLSNKMRTDRSVNYGWHDLRAKYASEGGVGAPKIWQPASTAHNLDHTDYSQTLRLYGRLVELDGHPWDLFTILQHPIYSAIFSAEGVLKVTRHPSVPPFQTPTTVSWPQNVSEGSLGERCVQWCLQYVGVTESPGGSNDGPLMRKWLAPCARGYEDSRIVLGLSKQNWCAAMQCAAMRACLLPGEVPPHDYRAGVVELVADAQRVVDGVKAFSGEYHSIKETHAGTFLPSTGDLAIWDRADPSRPETSWYRHVNRVIQVDTVEKTFRAVGGNEMDAVRVQDYALNSPKLLGWIHYPTSDTQAVSATSELDPADRERVLQQVGMCLAELTRKLWNV